MPLCAGSFFSFLFLSLFFSSFRNTICRRVAFASRWVSAPLFDPVSPSAHARDAVGSREQGPPCNANSYTEPAEGIVLLYGLVRTESNLLTTYGPAQMPSPLSRTYVHIPSLDGGRTPSLAVSHWCPGVGSSGYYKAPSTHSPPFTHPITNQVDLDLDVCCHESFHFHFIICLHDTESRVSRPTNHCSCALPKSFVSSFPPTAPQSSLVANPIRAQESCNKIEQPWYYRGDRWGITPPDDMKRTSHCPKRAFDSL